MKYITEREYRERKIGIGIGRAGGANNDWLQKVEENLEAQWASSQAISWWRKLFLKPDDEFCP